MNRNGGEWTDARYHSFITGALRSASHRWPPKWKVKTKARVERGKYLCSGYEVDPHIVPAKETNVDHISPIIDPDKGFISWDDFIERLFCEEEGLQVLCKDCHARKTKNERIANNARKRNSIVG